MAKPYPLPGGLDALLQPSTADRIIGTREDKRSTKTYIPGEVSAQDLALLLRRARENVRMVMRAHNKAAKLPHDPDLKESSQDWQDHKLSWDQVCLFYPGAQTWMETHTFFVEHYSSLEGFSVGATVRLMQSQLLEEKKRADSSIQTPTNHATNGIVKTNG